MAVVLQSGCRLGVELGQEGTGVAGAEPSSGGQLASADRRSGGAEFGVDALLGLGALGQHLSACVLESALAGRWSALTSAEDAAGSALTSARYSRLSTAKLPSSHTGVAPAVRQPTQGGWGDRDLEQGGPGDRGDQQQPRQRQHGPMRWASLWLSAGWWWPGPAAAQPGA